MRTKIIQALNFTAKSLLYLIIAMVFLIILNKIGESDWFDPYFGGFWRSFCFKQVISQAEKDESMYSNFRTKKYESLSPSRDKVIIEYEMLNRDNFYLFDETYLGGKTVIAVQVANLGQASERYVYIGGDNIRDPQWLGDNHVFFSTGCGTNCETFYLLDVNSKELRVGTINSIVDTSYNRWRTAFRDCYGVQFVFSGEVNTIRSEVKDDKSYLVFELGNGQSDHPEERRFLFTGNALILEI